MKTFSRFSAIVAILLLASAARGADDIAAGTVNSIDPNKKQLVLTDSGGSEVKFKLADNVLINRGGQVSRGELKPGEMVQIHYDKGLVNSTAKYILVREGDSKNWAMAHGNFKNYDSNKKSITLTDDQGRDLTYALGEVTVRLNDQDANAADIKIGDHVLAIVDSGQDPGTVKSLVVERK